MTRAFAQLPEACRDLDGAEFKALFGLHLFADSGGRCFPGMRRLAQAAGLAIGTLSRALKALAQRGAIEIRKRGGTKTNIYFIAEAFRVRRAPPAGGCSRIETKGRARESEQVDKPESVAAREVGKINMPGVLRRGAPLGAARPAAPKPAPSGPSAGQLAPAGPYALAVREAKRQRWLSRLQAWALRRFTEAQAWAALELISAGASAASRAATPSAVRKRLDDLDKLYRLECPARPA
jgi:DNA-binding transcriptional ArsR family regulator